MEKNEMVKAESSQIAKTETTALSAIPEAALKTLERAGASAVMFHPEVFAAVEKMAGIMASARCMIPEHLAGKPEDCFAVILQSMQWEMNPFAVAQKTHLVHGILGYEAQLVNAVVMNSGAISGHFEYEFYGPWENVIGKFQIKTGKNGNEYQVPAWTLQDEKGCGVKISATLKKTGKTKTLDLLLSQATVRNSTLWASDPKQQLAYLGVKRWSRLYAPGAIMGVYTPDELEESDNPPEKNVTPKKYKQPKASTQTAAKEDKAEVPQETEATENESLNFDTDSDIADTVAVIDEAKQKRFWTVARNLGISEEKIRSYLRVFYGIESTKNIPENKYEEIMADLKAGLKRNLAGN
ncbi:MAG: hypothetical protein A2017_18150 [Lentisphaerae bacterium GWF2_44_16]|nr:MAG: hypothetical protein A2017_18150 [Lentisphaerae bacterium GWF2_44_16]